MSRKSFLLTVVTCLSLGAWAGWALEREAFHVDGLAASAYADATAPDNRELSNTSSNAAPSSASEIAPTVLAAANANKAADDAAGDDDGSDEKLRIICFGAHPDDCEIKAGGVAAMWSARGHHVKFVSVTNGDIGHWREAGGPLAQRRNAEVQRAADILGITTEVLDIHDGELMPTLENRRKIVRLIRDWKADIVMGPRTNDYHPDHRYTGVLVQDAAYMVAVPFFCPEAQPLKENPVFLYYPDRFQKPYPFEADVAVGIDSVMDPKLDALVGMESQFVEGGALGSADLIAGGEAKLVERRRYVRSAFEKRDRRTGEKYREELKDWYGDEQAEKIAYAEAFEVCEYGRQPTDEELRKLFPFFSK